MDLVMTLDPLLDKMASFGFACQEVDGNDMRALLGAYEVARQSRVPAELHQSQHADGQGRGLARRLDVPPVALSSRGRRLGAARITSAAMNIQVLAWLLRNIDG